MIKKQIEKLQKEKENEKGKEQEQRERGIRGRQTNIFRAFWYSKKRCREQVNKQKAQIQAFLSPSLSFLEPS